MALAHRRDREWAAAASKSYSKRTTSKSTFPTLIFTTTMLTLDLTNALDASTGKSLRTWSRTSEIRSSRYEAFGFRDYKS